MTGKRAGAPLEALSSGMSVVLGRAPLAEERRRFARYLELLREWDRVHDLTGLTDPHDIVRALFLDSLLFLTQMPESRPLRIVDIGTGAGIPGIPLRIVDPGLRVTLVESRQKRVSFLSTARRELGLDDLDIREGRAERLVEEMPGLRGEFDCVLVRAVRLGPELVAALRAYLRPRGRLIAAGPPSEKALPGLEVAVKWSVSRIPGLGVSRRFLVMGPENLDIAQG